MFSFNLNGVNASEEELDVLQHNIDDIGDIGINLGDDLNYRPKKEVRLWKGRDPIKLTEKYGLKNNLINQDLLKNIQRKIKKNIIRSFIEAEKDKPLKFKSLNKFL